MKKLISLATIILMLMLLGMSSSSFAGKIYKWTDKDGKVHYGERPPSGNAKQMRVPRSAPRGAAPAPKPVDRMKATNTLLDSMATERKEKKEADDLAAKDKATKDKNCSLARRHVASLKMGGRRFEVNEQGERNYLDGAAIQSRLKKAQKDVAEWCK